MTGEDLTVDMKINPTSNLIPVGKNERKHPGEEELGVLKSQKEVSGIGVDRRGQGTLRAV